MEHVEASLDERSGPRGPRSVTRHRAGLSAECGIEAQKRSLNGSTAAWIKEGDRHAGTPSRPSFKEDCRHGGLVEGPGEAAGTPQLFKSRMPICRRSGYSRALDRSLFKTGMGIPGILAAWKPSVGMLRCPHVTGSRSHEQAGATRNGR